MRKRLKKLRDMARERAEKRRALLATLRELSLPCLILVAGILWSAAPYLPADTTSSLQAVLRKKANAGGGGGSYDLFEEYAEGTNTPANWSDGGTVDWDSTSSPLEGSESVVVSSSFGNTKWNNGSEISEWWVYVRVNSAGWAVNENIGFLDSAESTEAYVDIRSDRVVIGHGTATDSQTGMANNSTDIEIWVHYKAETTPGSSADGVLRAYYNVGTLTGTRPAAGVEVTTGTGDAAQFVRFWNNNTANAHKWDYFLGSTSEIGDL